MLLIIFYVWLFMFACNTTQAFSDKKYWETEHMLFLKRQLDIASFWIKYLMIFFLIVIMFLLAPLDFYYRFIKNRL